MSRIIQVFLLLAAIVCISTAQVNEVGQYCLCKRMQNRISPNFEIQDIQVYPATFFCDKVEIVVLVNGGLRFCLNPELPTVKKIIRNIMKKKTPPTAAPATTQLTSDSPF